MAYDIPFHTLQVGEHMEFASEHEEEVRRQANAYKKHWRMFGWTWNGTFPTGSVFRITRLPNHGKGVNLLKRVEMPDDIQEHFFKLSQDEIIRVFEKVLTDGNDYTGLKPEMRTAGIVPLSLVRNYCSRLSVFKKHSFTFEAAFNRALKSVLDKQLLRKHRTGIIDFISKG